MVDSERQSAFGRDKLTALPCQCLDCPMRAACNGGCPKHRFTLTADGRPGLNYLCRDYLSFFSHVDRPMRLMAPLYRAGRAPAEVMGMLH